MVHVNKNNGVSMVVDFRIYWKKLKNQANSTIAPRQETLPVVFQSEKNKKSPTHGLWIKRPCTAELDVDDLLRA